jgi:hypothetical protein
MITNQKTDVEIHEGRQCSWRPYNAPERYFLVKIENGL